MTTGFLLSLSCLVTDNDNSCHCQFFEGPFLCCHCLVLSTDNDKYCLVIFWSRQPLVTFVIFAFFESTKNDDNDSYCRVTVIVICCHFDNYCRMTTIVIWQLLSPKAKKFVVAVLSLSFIFWKFIVVALSCRMTSLVIVIVSSRCLVMPNPD